MDRVLSHHSLSMTDLTLLHAPSTLYLPEVKNETGLRFASNRWSLPPSPRPVISATPMVTVEMFDTGSLPPSPVMVQDHNFLSPPRRSSKSKDFRVPRARPASAPPSRPSKVRTIDPRGRLSPDLKSPGPASGHRSSIPVLVRPPTTLCMCIVS
jgi:hypothetical protein